MGMGSDGVPSFFIKGCSKNFVLLLTCICLSRGLFRMTVVTAPHYKWRHTGAIVHYWYVYRV
jgi:hypothetical protein